MDSCSKKGISMGEWLIKDSLYFEEENIDNRKETDADTENPSISLPFANIHPLNPEEVDRLYFFDGKDLGNTYHKDKTCFRLWAPAASEAKLVTYEQWDDSAGLEIEMARSEKGTWFAELCGDHDGLIYTYKVKIGEVWDEAVDPYVRAVTVNGDKGVVVDLADTNPKNGHMTNLRLMNRRTSSSMNYI